MPKRKKKLGRPPLPADEIRENVLCVRLTDDELAAIEDAAADADKPVRVWLRDKVLRGLPGRRRTR